LDDVMKTSYLDKSLYPVFAAAITVWSGWSLTYHLHLWLVQFMGLHSTLQQKHQMFQIHGLPYLPVGMLREELHKIFRGKIMGYAVFILCTTPPAYLTWLNALF
jgi:hypothetical protein